MAEAKATSFRMPADTLSEEESLTTEIVQTYSDLEVSGREVQPQRIAINPKLLEAARSGYKGILVKLLQPKDVSSGASMEEFTITVPKESATQKDTNYLLGVTPDGNTILHIVASRGHLELAQEIYYTERSLLEAQNVKLETPLHCAARAGDDKMVSLIIRFAKEEKIEARVLRATNKDDANALHEAAKYDHVRVANVLMEDAELASKQNYIGMSPLYLAIMMGSLNVAKALLQSFSWEKASLKSYAGPGNHTALHAASNKSREITEAILQRKPMLAMSADDLGRIPLHNAALNGHRDTVKLLLEHNPSTAYQSDADGFFPIHLATMMGNIGVVDQILKQCPDTDELVDKEGKNFLHAAFKWGKLDLVKKILSKRPDLRKLLNDQDDMGNTPLHTAVMSKDPERVYFLLQDESVHVNIMNLEGWTPLRLAWQKSYERTSAETNEAYDILRCLVFTKALFGVPPKLLAFKNVGSSSDRDKTKPPSVDKVKEKSPSDEDKEKPSMDDKVKENSSADEEKEWKEWQNEQLKKQLDLPKNLVVVTVLIATVTFAAGVAVPGGYVDDDHPDRGTSVLAKKYAFKVFQVSDVFAFVFSILATFWLIDAGTSMVDRRSRRRALLFALRSLQVAFSGMSTAFAMGIYAASAHSYKSISILLCIIALATPILADVVSNCRLYKFRMTVGMRQGFGHWIWPTAVYPHVENTLHPILIPRGAIIYDLLLILGSYVIFFLLPMLLACKS